MQQRADTYYTLQEYLAREASAEYKSEYYDGEIYAMAGGSRNHNLIEGNVVTILNQGVEHKPCEVYPSDMRVLVKRNAFMAYPDVMVACGKIEFMEGRTDVITNPVVIVEVLSPSTREYDRVQKYARYTQLESLQDYILVGSERVHVTHLRREPGSRRWTIDMYDEPEDVLLLESIGVELPLARVYRKVELAPEP